MNLFGENTQVIRTLGFYQPWGSLMLHGKIETRKVRIGYKPPYPKGMYLFYTTKRVLTDHTVYGWCGEDIYNNITKILVNEPTINLHGYAIGIGKLVNIRPMTDTDEEKCFVSNDDILGKYNWCLEFENVKRIEPFEFKFGKQGVGILPETEREKIFLVN